MKDKIYRAVIEKKVAKDLRKIEPKQREIVLSWIDKTLDGCTDPYGIPGAKKLLDVERGVRYRVGKYRILARVDDDQVVVVVFRVGHRGSVYQNLPQ